MYGIKNCDTCRKAMKWLDEAGTAYRFHDFRKDGLAAEDLAKWLGAVDRDVLINRRGTTYRQLDDLTKAALEGVDPAPALLAAPTLIKRPVFAHNGTYIVGFGSAQKAALKELVS